MQIINFGLSAPTVCTFYACLLWDSAEHLCRLRILHRSTAVGCNLRLSRFRCLGFRDFTGRGVVICVRRDESIGLMVRDAFWARLEGYRGRGSDAAGTISAPIAEMVSARSLSVGFDFPDSNFWEEMNNSCLSVVIYLLSCIQNISAPRSRCIVPKDRCYLNPQGLGFVRRANRSAETKSAA